MNLLLGIYQQVFAAGLIVSTTFLSESQNNVP